MSYGNQFGPYFQIGIIPLSKATSGIIKVKNFHPEWKDAVKLFKEVKIEDYFSKYLDEINKWSKLPLSAEFSEEYGLTHLRFLHRAGLDLIVEKEMYISHNVHSVQEVGAISTVISHYINRLNTAIEELKNRK